MYPEYRFAPKWVPKSLSKLSSFKALVQIDFITRDYSPTSFLENQSENFGFPGISGSESSIILIFVKKYDFFVLIYDVFTMIVF